MSGWDDAVASSPKGAGGSGGGDMSSIASGIQKINSNYTQMKGMVGQLGSGADNSKFRQKLHNLLETTQNLARTSQKQIQAQKKRQLNAAEKQQLGKLVTQFQSAVKSLEDVAKQSKKRQHSGSHMAAKEPNLDLTQAQAYDTSNVDVDLALVEERNKDIELLEQDIVALNELTLDVATLVEDQQQGLDIIDQNVTQASERVEKGVEELHEANRQQKKARKKMCCIVAIILVVVAATLGTALPLALQNA